MEDILSVSDCKLSGVLVLLFAMNSLDSLPVIGLIIELSPLIQAPFTFHLLWLLLLLVFPVLVCEAECSGEKLCLLIVFLVTCGELASTDGN